MELKKENLSIKTKYTEPTYRKRKIQRNDTCPCGSGKKVKNCHPKFLK